MEGSPKPQEKSETNESLEKMEVVGLAKELYDDLLQYDRMIVDKAVNDDLKAKSAQLKSYLTEYGLTWQDKVANGLPWNPRDELEAEVANENRPLSKEAA